VAFVDLNIRQLTGREPPPLTEVEPGRWVQPAVASAYQAMQQAAATAGIALRIASGWRDFSRQRAIFAAKMRGERVVFNLAQQPVNLTLLPFAEQLQAILLYSALPGASRHHWGTDLDVWDAAAVGPDYPLQLSPAEYSSGGPFARLSDWLAHNAAGFGFFRPYLRDQGGVATEPWHLSYQPLAGLYLPQLNVAALTEALSDQSAAELLPQHQQICAMLPELLQRYVLNIDGEEHDN